MPEWETIIPEEEEEYDARVEHDTKGLYTGEIFDGYLGDRPGYHKHRGPLARVRRQNIIHGRRPLGRIKELWQMIEEKYEIGDIVSHQAINEFMPEVSPVNLSSILGSLWHNFFLDKWAQGRWDRENIVDEWINRGWRHFGVHWEVLGDPRERDMRPTGVIFYDINNIAEEIKPFIHMGSDFTREGKAPNNKQNLYNLSLLYCLLNGFGPTFHEANYARTAIINEAESDSASWTKGILEALEEVGLVVLKREKGDRHMPGHMKFPELERGEWSEFVHLARARLIKTENEAAIVSGAVKAVAVPHWEIPSLIDYKSIWANDIVKWSLGDEMPNWYDQHWLWRRYAHQ